MAGKPPLKRLVEVRVLIPELLALATPMIFDNQIVDVKKAGRHSRRHRPGSSPGDERPAEDWEGIVQIGHGAQQAWGIRLLGGPRPYKPVKRVRFSHPLPTGA
jgi:hypothetical protein